MALTISTHPTLNMGNDAQFTVDTSLVEDSDHQNLRIRATIYIGGETEAKAVLEQPDGLNDWDFFEVLKSFIGKCDTAIGGSTRYTLPTLSSELLTGWTNFGGSFETFVVSGKRIVSAIDSNAGGGVAQSNDLGSGVAGDIYLVGLEEDFVDSGVADFTIILGNIAGSVVHSKCQYAGLSSDKLQDNHLYFAMMKQTETTPAINIISTAGSNGEIEGTATIHKITDFKNNPGVYYHIKFEEVFEDSDYLTTIGDDEWGDCMLFVPGVGRAGEVWNTDRVITEAGKELITRAEDGDALYKFGIGMEMRLMYLSTAPYLAVQYDVDGGGSSVTWVGAGWGMIVINDTSFSLIDAEDETIEIILRSVESDASLIYTGASVIINCEIKCYPDIKALSFVGLLGGEETMLFRGLHSESGMADKSYYKDVNRTKKVLKADRYTRHKLRTQTETEGVRRLLHELIYSELDVWMYDEDETDGYKIVTVIDSNTRITNQNELFDSAIDIEYHE